MKTVSVGSRAAAGEMIEQIWGCESDPNDSDCNFWSPLGEIREWLDSGLRAVVRRPEILWGTREEIQQDISRILRREHGQL